MAHTRLNTIRTGMDNQLVRPNGKRHYATKWWVAFSWCNNNLTEKRKVPAYIVEYQTALNLFVRTLWLWERKRYWRASLNLEQSLWKMADIAINGRAILQGESKSIENKAVQITTEDSKKPILQRIRWAAEILIEIGRKIEAAGDFRDILERKGVFGRKRCLLLRIIWPFGKRADRRETVNQQDFLRIHDLVFSGALAQIMYEKLNELYLLYLESEEIVKALAKGASCNEFLKDLAKLADYLAEKTKNQTALESVKAIMSKLEPKTTSLIAAEN